MAKKKQEELLYFELTLIDHDNYVDIWTAELQEHDDWHTYFSESIAELFTKVCKIWVRVEMREKGILIQGFDLNMNNPVTVRFVVPKSLSIVSLSESDIHELIEQVQSSD